MIKQLGVSIGILAFSTLLSLSCSKDEPVTEPVSSTPQKPAAPPEELLEAEAKKAAESFEPGRVHFDFDRSEIKPQYESVLNSVSEHLKKTGSLFGYKPLMYKIDWLSSLEIKSATELENYRFLISKYFNK